jgi:nucleoside-diphosphate-sugar epimerase
MATLLVIGGSGFFGKSILDAFQRDLLDVWNIDEIIIMARHATDLKKNNPDLIAKRVKLINGDITSINILPFADFVIHAAASTDTKTYLASPVKERANIIAGTLNYCNLAKNFHQKSKIVYVSSGAVYGPQPHHLYKIPEDFLFLDADQLSESKRCYAYAKRDSEKEIIDLGLNGLDVSIARCFAFVGPWLPLDQHFAIGNFINDGLNNKKIEVTAQHKVYRSYMYADDLVEWLMTIAENSHSNCPVYNVGSDQEILIEDLASMMSNIFSVKTSIPLINDAKIDRYIPSINKAKKELGLNLKFNLIQSINETILKLGGVRNNA